MGSAFHQLCPRYSGTPTAPTAIRLWETFTFTFLTLREVISKSCFTLYIKNIKITLTLREVISKVVFYTLH